MKSAQAMMGFFALFLAFGHSARADGTNIQTSIPSTSDHFVLTEDALLKNDCCEGFFAGMNYIYLSNPLVTIDTTTNSRANVIVNHIHTFDGFLAYRFKTNATVGIAAPFNWANRPGGDPQFAFGDMRAFLKWRFTSSDAPIAVAIMPELRAPTGSTALFTSDDSWMMGFRLVAEKDFSYFVASAHAGYWHFENSAFLNLVMRDRIPLGLGLMVPFSRRDHQLGANIEVNAQPVINDSTLNPTQLYAGLRWDSPEGFVATIGASLGKFGGPSGADFGVHVGLRLNLYNCPEVKRVAAAPAPAPKPVVAAAPVPRVRLTRKTIELTEEVKFKEDSDILTDSGQDLLDEVAKVIKDADKDLKKIHVDGHTNKHGGYKYNIDLSMRRAIAVKEYLESRGVRANLLQPRWYGYTRPKKVPGLSAKQHLEVDRRVEFKVERPAKPAR